MLGRTREPDSAPRAEVSVRRWLLNTRQRYLLFVLFLYLTACWLPAVRLTRDLGWLTGGLDVNGWMMLGGGCWSISWYANVFFWLGFYCLIRRGYRVATFFSWGAVAFAVSLWVAVYLGGQDYLVDETADSESVGRGVLLAGGLPRAGRWCPLVESTTTRPCRGPRPRTRPLDKRGESVRRCRTPARDFAFPPPRRAKGSGRDGSALIAA